MSENVKPEKKPQNDTNHKANKYEVKVIIQNIVSDVKEDGIVKFFLWSIPILAGILLPPILPPETHTFIWIFLAIFIFSTLVYFIAKQFPQKTKNLIWKYFIILITVILAVYIFSHFTTKTPETATLMCNNPVTPWEFYHCEKEGTLGETWSYVDTVENINAVFDIRFKVNLDLKNYYIICFYHPKPVEDMIFYCSALLYKITDLEKKIKTGAYWGEIVTAYKKVNLKECTFTNQVFVYHNNWTPTIVSEEVTAMFKEQDMTVDLRGFDYTQMERFRRKKDNP